MAKTIVIVVIVLIALLVTSVIVVVGIYLFSDVVPPGDIELYQERYAFYYTPEALSEVEEIDIYSDVSRFKIQYTDDEAHKRVEEFIAANSQPLEREKQPIKQEAKK